MKYELDIRSPIFAEMYEQFNTSLLKTLKRMTQTKADEASITLKLNIDMQQTNVGSPTEVNFMPAPVFTHTVSANIPQKGKISGGVQETLIMLTDEDGKIYLVRQSDGQINLFDEEG